MGKEMARRARIECPGAIYHVINRGNYRSDVFGSPGAAQAFVTALEETVGMFGWKLGAFAVMRNHFHLAVQTPEPNLAAGMQRLQVTCAARFNRFRREQGHLFQGRYRAIVLENEGVWARVANYIHLNPVRAGIVSKDQASNFRWSSWGCFEKNQLFTGLDAQPWLATLGLGDTESGWREYGKTLQERFGYGEGQVESE
jgi:putative transposase